MEQIRIRQPKMTAAQSFIQILGTFLAILINCPAVHFYYKNNKFSMKRTSKTIGNTRFKLKKPNFTLEKKKLLEVIKLRI